MIRFNESSWTYIEALLPEQEDIKKAVLNDFIWFMNRPIKYKDDASKIDDYVHYLELKKESPFKSRSGVVNKYEHVNISNIESELKLLFL